MLFLIFFVNAQQQIVIMLRKHRSLGHDKEMLRNLDILAFKQYTVQQLKNPPSLQKARLEVQQTYPRDSFNKQHSLLCEISQFKKYGPGVYLIFRFIKYLLIVMGILIPLPITNMIVLVVAQDHYVDKNMQTDLQTTTISNMTDNNNTLVISLNFVVLFVLTISMLYWRYIQTDEILSCTKKTCLSSYYTAILTKIPNYYSEHDLVQFLQRNYGKVHSIYTVKNYQQDLGNYESMNRILAEYKEQRELFLRKGAKDECLGLVQLFLSYKQKHEAIIENVVKNTNYQPIQAFVTFQTVSSRNNLLADLQVKFNFCGSKTKRQVDLGDQFLYKGQRLQFRSCQMQPNGIIWQNINVPLKQKIIRISLIVCLLTAFLFISVTIFFVLAAAQSSLYSDQYEHYPIEELLELNNPKAIKSYCIDLSYSLFRQKPYCQPYFMDYVNYFILYLAFPFFVTFLKGVFVLMMKKLVIIRRHKYQFYKIKWEIAIVTLFYFLKTGLIKWIIYRSFSIGSARFQLIDVFSPILNQMARFFPIRPDLIPDYQDFNKQWVAHASHKTILIAMVSFNFTILFSYLVSLISKKYKEKTADSQPTFTKMKQSLKGQQFQFQFIYSQLLALFLFCMLYFSCSPTIYLFVYISILLLYWVSKHRLLRLSQIPPVYAHSINQMAVKIILIGLMLNSLVSPLYYANLDEQNHSSWPQRWLTYWYYTLNFFIILLSLTCRTHIIRLYFIVKNKMMDFVESGLHEQKYEKRINSMAPISNFLKSYSMHSSQKYQETLRILFALNRSEVQKLGYFTQKDIEEIKNCIEQPENQFKLFSELEYFLSQQIKNGEKQTLNSKFYRKNKQKYESYKRQFEKIREQVDIQIQQQLKLMLVHNIVNNKLVQLNKSKVAMNIFQDAEKKSFIKQGIAKVAIPEEMDQCMNTDIRIA